MFKPNFKETAEILELIKEVRSKLCVDRKHSNKIITFYHKFCKPPKFYGGAFVSPQELADKEEGCSACLSKAVFYIQQKYDD